MKISHYWADDWEAYYIDGNIYYQHHSLRASELLYLLEKDGYLASPVKIEYISHGKDYTNTLKCFSRFPEKEEDIATLIEEEEYD